MEKNLKFNGKNLGILWEKIWSLMGQKSENFREKIWKLIGKNLKFKGKKIWNLWELNSEIS